MASEGEDRTQRELDGQPHGWLAKAVVSQTHGRLIEPEEVARAVAFLASEESGLMTGAIINFDQAVWELTTASRMRTRLSDLRFLPPLRIVQPFRDKPYCKRFAIALTTGEPFTKSGIVSAARSARPSRTETP